MSWIKIFLACCLYEVFTMFIDDLFFERLIEHIWTYKVNSLITNV